MATSHDWWDYSPTPIDPALPAALGNERAGTLVSIAVAIPGYISAATYRWRKTTTESAVL
jgi:hypothetical protein